MAPRRACGRSSGRAAALYLDHLTDAFSTIAIGLGLGLSPYMLLSVGLAIVAFHGAVDQRVSGERVLGDFRFGYGVVGPPDRG
jgi:hypothetical protein